MSTGNFSENERKIGPNPVNSASRAKEKILGNSENPGKSRVFKGEPSPLPGSGAGKSGAYKYSLRREYSKGSTAQFGKKSQTGFLRQFKLKKWGKKTAETRRRNCAVLPKRKFPGRHRRVKICLPPGAQVLAHRKIHVCGLFALLYQTFRFFRKYPDKRSVGGHIGRPWTVEKPCHCAQQHTLLRAESRLRRLRSVTKSGRSTVAIHRMKGTVYRLAPKAFPDSESFQASSQTGVGISRMKSTTYRFASKSRRFPYDVQAGGGCRPYGPHGDGFAGGAFTPRPLLPPDVERGERSSPASSDSGSKRGTGIHPP